MQINTQEFILEFKRLMQNLEFLLSESTPCSIRQLNYGVDVSNSNLNGVGEIVE